VTGVDRQTFLRAVGLGVAAAALAGPPAAAVAAPGTRPLLIGTYTDGPNAGKGVTLGGWQPSTGVVTAGDVLAVANPSFFARSPMGGHVYAVDEQGDGRVTALAVSRARLEVVNSQSSMGAGPTHLCVAPGGRHLLTANYDSGSVAVHPIAADGSLLPASDLVQHTGSGPDPDRQRGPHAHQVTPDPVGEYLHAVDLGTDSVYAYRLDPETGRLALHHQARLPAGSGPRHVAFHPTSRFAYVACELGNIVSVCSYRDGVLTAVREVPATTVDVPGVRNYPAEILVSADGRHVYLSNRGADSVAVFAVAADGGLMPLTAPSCGGSWPRHIGLDPTGQYLFCANQNSGTVTSFAVDPVAGGLTPVGTPLATPSPVCTLAL